MTTLNEKAREYSNYALAQDGYIAGYTEALRWRDVNVELPEEDEKDSGISKNILLKFSVYGKKHKNTYECCIESFFDTDTESWHTMIPLDEKNLKLTPIAWRPIETI